MKAAPLEIPVDVLTPLAAQLREAADRLDPGNSADLAYRKGFEDGRDDARREKGIAGVPTIKPAEVYVGDVKVDAIAEAGTYEVPQEAEPVRSWQDRNPGQVEKLTAELAEVRKQRDKAEKIAEDRAELLNAADRAIAEANQNRDVALTWRDDMRRDLAAERAEWKSNVDALVVQRAEILADRNRAQAERDACRAAMSDALNARDEARKIAEQFADRTVNPFATRALPWRGAKPEYTTPSDAYDACIAGTCGHAARFHNAAAPMVQPS